MLRILHEDEDILQGMIEDSSLAETLQTEIEPIVGVSPYLYFAVLLGQAHEDLKSRPYTFEKETRRMLVIFDTKRILDLLSEKRMMIYLARMLASFTKIRSHSVMIHGRNGVWRRMRYSDFDVESLISYCAVTDEEYLFPTLQTNSGHLPVYHGDIRSYFSRRREDSISSQAKRQKLPRVRPPLLLVGSEPSRGKDRRSSRNPHPACRIIRIGDKRRWRSWPIII